MVATELRGQTALAASVTKDVRALQSKGESPFFQLLRLAEDREAVISLGRGEPDLPTPSHIIGAAKQALDEGRTHYTDPSGLPELRQAIARKLKADQELSYDAGSEIVVTAGAQEALAVALRTLLEPGDEVLVPSPHYAAYEVNIRLAGGVPVFINTSLDTAFEVDAEMLMPHIGPRTKLLAVVSPANPTSAVIRLESLEAIARVALDNDLIVISDELYEKVVYDGFVPRSISSFPGMRDRTVIINGFSKAYSMTGFRVGYLAAPADYCVAAAEVRHAMSISTPTISQLAALAALQGPQDSIAEMVAEYSRRRDVMDNVLTRLDIPHITPRGAFFFFPSIARTGIDSFDFCRRAVADYGVLMFPGSMYGTAGEGYVRMSFLAPIDELREALDRFATLYESLVK
jgi:aminotransferase